MRRRFFSRLYRITQFLLAISLLVLSPLAIIYGLGIAWDKLESLQSDLAIAVITAAATIIVGTMTVMLGRRNEKVRDIEAHFRPTKIEMYDEFLKEFFKLFQEGGDTTSLVPFLQEWQRRLILWAGPDVLRSYFNWRTRLRTGVPDAPAMLAMDAFFRSLRKDIGQSSFGIERGAFVHLILRHPEVFLKAARDNPKVTLAEISEIEKKLGLE